MSNFIIACISVCIASTGLGIVLAIKYVGNAIEDLTKEVRKEKGEYIHFAYRLESNALSAECKAKEYENKLLEKKLQKLEEENKLLRDLNARREQDTSDA